MSNTVMQVMDDVWNSVVGNAADGLTWLKSVLIGEFADHRALSVIVADMLASFLPGVVIVTSVRDAIAVILRLANHPEKRAQMGEWILLIACLIAIALPLVAAAAGAVVAGAGAIVTGIAGSELAAALRAVILLLIKEAGKLVEMVGFLNRFIKGDILKFLRAIKFAEYEKAILQVFEQLTNKLIGIAQTVRKRLCDTKLFNTRVADHLESLNRIIQKLSDWERQFYDLQKIGLTQIPKAIVELQVRLDKLLSETLPKELQVANAGVAAEKPHASTLVLQEVHDAVGKNVRDRGGGKRTSNAVGSSDGGRKPSDSHPPEDKPPRKDKPESPPTVQDQPNVKVEAHYDPLAEIGVETAAVKKEVIPLKGTRMMRSSANEIFIGFEETPRIFVHGEMSSRVKGQLSISIRTYVDREGHLIRVNGFTGSQAYDEVFAHFGDQVTSVRNTYIADNARQFNALIAQKESRAEAIMHTWDGQQMLKRGLTLDQVIAHPGPGGEYNDIYAIWKKGQ